MNLTPDDIQPMRCYPTCWPGEALVAFPRPTRRLHSLIALQFYFDGSLGGPCTVIEFDRSLVETAPSAQDAIDFVVNKAASTLIRRRAKRDGLSWTQRRYLSRAHGIPL